MAIKDRTLPSIVPYEHNPRNWNPDQILKEYRWAVVSREASYLGRKEVLTGKAKFGIFGDGKELPQVVLARYFKPGDWRSGYYRDQTWMFVSGICTVRQFFAQLYADPDLGHDPMSGGRQMNAHFASRILDGEGRWKSLTQHHHTSADSSPTSSQMPRLVGLGYASKLYRELEALHELTQFSNYGNEIAWGSIGNASAAEGLFWESVDAIGNLMVPVILSIWDDDYGISVPNTYQHTKYDVGELLKGFEYDPNKHQGYYLFRVRCWNYAELTEAYAAAEYYARHYHIPAIVHVVECTQPQGHSTSGSHERYKTKNRLEWERQYDCIRQFRQWILKEGLADEATLNTIDKEAKQFVRKEQKAAWKEFTAPIKDKYREAIQYFESIANATPEVSESVRKHIQSLNRPLEVSRKHLFQAIYDVLIATRRHPSTARDELIAWKNQLWQENRFRYGSHLYSEGDASILKVTPVPPRYSDDAPMLNGYEIINRYFDALLARDPRVFFIGEDVGQIGDVNQGLAGLQAKYGELRVTDTGIREATIVGQGIGSALRGLRPIVEIQYLDYLLFALQTMSDDIATMRWRTVGGQKVPLIIRTRGHRLEGIWHSGSPMGGILHLTRGIRIAVPRNFVEAAGLYNAAMASDEPVLIVERLNAYRLKERLPDNLAEITIPFGIPDIVRNGQDVTIVTYGACVDIVMDAAQRLEAVGADAEIIDVRTLNPFDVKGSILQSLKKTNRIVFVDEDVPGGATAFMMQEILERQQGYYWLDSEPITISGAEHRPAYGSDGDYFSKPNAEQIFERVYQLLNEADPARFPDRF